MCDSIQDCYTIFGDENFKSKGLNYDLIERWLDVNPYLDPSSNIGFAQAHAQAATFRLWMSNKNLTDEYNLSVFSEYSVMNAAFVEGYQPCLSPNGLKGNYFPFSFPDEEIVFFLNPAFSDIDQSNWCNSEFLSQVNVSDAVGFMFPGYDSKFLVNLLSYENIKSLLMQKGIGMTLIPHDYFMANAYGYYNDGYYKLTGPRLYDYIANVVGVQRTVDGEILFLVYAFGAHHPDTNYIWVKAKDLSTGSINFVKDFGFSG